MRLSLLTPPVESPRTIPQIPLPQDWPGERHLAVDTRALPRQLPPMADLGLVAMDPAASSAPFEALARAGSRGALIGAETLNLILEKEARTQEANLVADVTNTYATVVPAFDQKFEQAKVQTDHTTIRPAFDQIWKETVQPAMDAVKDPRAQRALGIKLAGYKITKLAEVSDVERTKFKANQLLSLTREVDLDAKLATEAPNDATRDFHLTNMQGTFRAYNRAGAIDVNVLETMQTKRLDQVRTDRAQNEAYRNPLTVLQRVATGETFGLETKELRTLSEYAESRLRTLRSDVDNFDAKQRREDKAKQDRSAMTMRQQITENYAAGGPGRDMLGDVNGSARLLGESNHTQLIEMERVYRERYTKPPVAIKSDKHTVGQITTAFRTGNLTEYTDRDLLRLLDNNVLDEGDHRYLSGLRAQILEQRKTEAQKGVTEAEHVRKEQIRDAEKTVQELLKRGNRLAGDTAAVTTDILAADAITELHQRLQADPSLRPDDVATDVVVSRIQRAEKFGSAISYKTKEEVAAAFQAGQLTKAQATRYFRVLDALGAGKRSQAAPVEPAAPGLAERFKNWWTPPESPVRTPAK